MEKLLDFKESKIMDDSKVYRFQCDCLTAADAMDISVDKVRDEEKFFILTLNFLDNHFWGRLKYAWQIIRGHWCWREFVVREEDCKDLSDIFNPDKGYSELP